MICLGNTWVLQCNFSQARPFTVTFPGPFTCGDDGTKFSRLVPRVWVWKRWTVRVQRKRNMQTMPWTYANMIIKYEKYEGTGRRPGSGKWNMVDIRNAKTLRIREILRQINRTCVSLIVFSEARSVEKLDGSRSSWGGLCTMYSYVIRWCNSQLDRYDQARRELMRSVSISKFSLQKKHKKGANCVHFLGTLISNVKKAVEVLRCALLFLFDCGLIL